MNTLKLDAAISKRIREGHTTSLWYLYDDVDVKVNDVLVLVDEKTGDKFGTAIVDQVVDKRLGDLTDADFEEYENYDTPEAMYQALHQKFSSEVKPETVIKIINFRFSPVVESAGMAEIDVTKTSQITELKLYGDGGSRGNPGPSAYGYALFDMNDELVEKHGEYLGITTNNQAEYQSLKAGLQAAQRHGAREVHVYMDSLLVINQMKGIFKIKNRDLWPIHSAIQQLLLQFKSVKFTHVPRELNKVADGVVNETLDIAAEQK